MRSLELEIKIIAFSVCSSATIFQIINFQIFFKFSKVENLHFNGLFNFLIVLLLCINVVKIGIAIFHVLHFLITGEHFNSATPSSSAS